MKIWTGVNISLTLGIGIQLRREVIWTWCESYIIREGFKKFRNYLPLVRFLVTQLLILIDINCPYPPITIWLQPGYQQGSVDRFQRIEYTIHFLDNIVYGISHA
jgi:hypothetical protein